MRRQLSLLAILSVFFLPLASADAGLILGGNTNPSDAAGSAGNFQGTLNSAVFDLSGGTAGDSFGTGLAGFDALFLGGAPAGSYLYLYQAVNSGPSTREIFRATVDLTDDSFASIVGLPFVTSLDFVDAQGAISGSNDLGADEQAFSQDAGFDASAGSVSLATTTGGVIPTLSLTSHSFGAFFFPGFLAPGVKSTVYGFQSNLPPSIVGAALIDGASGNGMAPAPVPEPGMIAGLLSLLPILGLMWYRRR